MTFTIPGPPQGKARPRFSGHAYTPEKTKAYEESVAWAYRQAGGRLLTGPVRVSVFAYFAVPKSATKAQKAAMLSGGIRPTKRPDLDNICKAIFDGLNGVAFADDAQIVSTYAEKSYSPDPRVEVVVDYEPGAVHD